MHIQKKDYKKWIPVLVCLERHVIQNQILKRIDGLPSGCEYAEASRKYYQDLLDETQEGLGLKNIAEKTIWGLAKNFRIDEMTFDDILSSIVNDTVQDVSNEYQKKRKSTFGFWDVVFELDVSKSSFAVCFPHVFFRAFQTGLHRNKSHTERFQVMTGIGLDQFSLIDIAPDDCNDEGVEPISGQTDFTQDRFHQGWESHESLILSEKRFDEMFGMVITEESLDWISKEIFCRWYFSKVRKGDFECQIPMITEIYPDVASTIRHVENRYLSMVSLHKRWKSVQQYIQGQWAMEQKLDNYFIDKDGAYSMLENYAKEYENFRITSSVRRGTASLSVEELKSLGIGDKASVLSVYFHAIENVRDGVNLILKKIDQNGKRAGFDSLKNQLLAYLDDHFNKEDYSYSIKSVSATDIKPHQKTCVMFSGSDFRAVSYWNFLVVYHDSGKIAIVSDSGSAKNLFLCFYPKGGKTYGFDYENLIKQIKDMNIHITEM